MTREEIIAMARVAAQGEPASGKLCCELFAKAWTPFFDRFAALVEAAEREACAKVCDREAKQYFAPKLSIAVYECAHAIRTRGKEGSEK